MYPFLRAVSVAIKWMEKAVEEIGVWKGVRLLSSALLCCRESGTGTSPGTGHHCDQRKPAGAQPQTPQAGGQGEVVYRDMDRPSLGVTVRSLPLSISRILD